MIDGYTPFDEKAQFQPATDAQIAAFTETERQLYGVLRSAAIAAQTSDGELQAANRNLVQSVADLREREVAASKVPRLNQQDLLRQVLASSNRR